MLRRIKHFLQRKGFNFEVVVIEQVVVFHNAVNEFVGSDKKIKYSFYIPIIIDFDTSDESTEIDFLWRSFLKHHNLLD